MQKKIIALAIAAALTAPALAFAEVTVYGKANLSIDMIDDGVASPATSVTTNQLVTNSSRLGFKGSEDLGGGLSTIWQMEGSVGMDVGTTGTSMFDRNTFLGLKSASMGSIMFGRNDTPYKSATRRLDVFGDQTATDNRKQLGITMMGSISGLLAQDSRLGNSVTYVSPKLADAITVSASTVFGAEGANGTEKKGTLTSLAGMYEAGPLYAALAMQNTKYGSIASGDLEGLCTATTACVDDKMTALRLGAGYKMDALSLGLVFENLKFKEAAAPGDETKATNMYLSGKFAMSSTDAIKLAYTSRGESKTAGTDNKDGASSIAVGYDHAMSKATTLYAAYIKMSQDTVGAAEPSALSVGMVHSF